MKKTFIIITILSILSLTGCIQKESPVGSSYLDRQNFGDVAQKTLHASLNDTSFYVPTSTYLSSYLYIGHMEDMHAATLFRFSGIEDTVEIDSAVLIITVDHVNNASQIPATIDVYAVASSWEDSTVKTTDISTGLIGNLLGSITIASDTTDTLFYKLNKELLTTWMDTLTSDQNYGLYLDTNDDFMIQCYSSDISSSTGYGPLLIFYSSEDTINYPSYIEAYQDVFLTSSLTETNPDQLIIESGTAFRSFVEFDLSIFEPTDIINRAALILSADTLRLLPKNADAFTVLACNLDTLTDFQSMECQSDYISSGSVTDDECTVDLTYQIQSMVSGQSPNYGFLLESPVESSELSRIIFYSTTSDSAKQPRLDVIYTKSSSNQL